MISKTMMIKMFLIIAALLLFEIGNCEFNTLGLFRRLRRANEDYNKYELIRENKGSLVNPNPQPFVVYVGKMPQEGSNNSKVLCTGLLVNKSSVLTTASCATLFDKDQLEIGIKSDNGSLLHVSKVTLHPKYEPNITSVIKLSEYNVAILNLDKPVNESVVPAFASLSTAKDSTDLKMDDLVENKASCKSMGYGISSLHPKDAGLLRSYNMSLLHTDDCISRYNDSSINSSSHVCAWLEEAGDNCFYEDGAPLICENRVYALFAPFSSEECASKPNVFIRLDSLEDFLTTELLQTPSAEISAPFTPSAEISAPFTPSAEISAPFTPSAEISAPFTPSAEISAPFTPSAEISAPFTPSTEFPSSQSIHNMSLIKKQTSNETTSTEETSNEIKLTAESKDIIPSISAELSPDFLARLFPKGELISQYKGGSEAQKPSVIDFEKIEKRTDTTVDIRTESSPFTPTYEGNETDSFDSSLQRFDVNKIEDIRKRYKVYGGPASRNSDKGCAQPSLASKLHSPSLSFTTLSMYSLVLCLLGWRVPARPSLTEH